MWECPDYFKLDGKQILMASPQELTEEEGFYPGSISVFFIGDAGDGLSLKREAIQLIDKGPDFYAPQTMLAARAVTIIDRDILSPAAVHFDYLSGKVIC